MKKSLFNKLISKVIPSLAKEPKNLSPEELEQQQICTPNPNDTHDVTFAKIFTISDLLLSVASSLNLVVVSNRFTKQVIMSTLIFIELLGTGHSIKLSSLPGLKRAGSIKSGLEVAAMTKTL